MFNSLKNAIMSQKCAFWLFTDEMECERGKQDFSNKVIVHNATSVLIFQYKNAGKRVSKNIIQFYYYKGKSAKEIADMIYFKIRTVYIISRAEKRMTRFKRIYRYDKKI